jgi:N-acetylglucosamine-6-phosphate deacetylase
MVLVTDAMPSVGAADKSFMLNGELINCENGKLSTANGTLAGSDLDMLSAVKNTVEMAGIDLDEAIQMASKYPAAMMGENHLGAIKVGYNASMILIDENFNQLRSWIDGSEQ